MEAYRDQYARVFRGGRGVTVLGISNDSAEDLASWAADADFPVLFGSDDDNSAAVAFGVGQRDNGMPESRAVVVVDPEGRVAWTTAQFNGIDPMAYDDLAAGCDGGGSATRPRITGRRVRRAEERAQKTDQKRARPSWPGPLGLARGLIAEGRAIRHGKKWECKQLTASWRSTCWITSPILTLIAP